MDQHEYDPQSWNLYTYVGNNPLLFTDPKGLWKWVDPDNNGNRFLQWEEGDDWHTLSTFLYNETGRDYLASDLEAAYSSGGLGADTIVDVTGAPDRFFTNNRGGVTNVTFEHLANITPTGRGAKAGGGLLSRLWKWATGGGPKAATKAGRTAGNTATQNIIQSAPLKPLHKTLDQNTLQYFRGKSTEELLEALKPGSREALRVKPDGTIMNGNHRIQVLRERGVDVDSLPREPYP